MKITAVEHDLASSIPEPLRLEIVEDEFTRYRHPAWPDLQQWTRQWLIEQRLLPVDLASRYADELRYTDLIAGYYLGAKWPVLTAISDFSAWFFVWDDQHGQMMRHHDRRWWALSKQLRTALTAPAGHLADPDPLVAGFATSTTRLLGQLGTDWDDRFRAHFTGVLDAYDQEYHNKATGSIPTAEDYILLRRNTFAHWVWIDLLELVASAALPTAVRDSEPYQRAMLAAFDFSAWYNDLCSLPKERAAGELHNLGISLIHHHGLSVEQAVTEVRERVRERVVEFLRAEHDARALDRAAGGAWPGLHWCLFNARNWISSVYWFHHESGRYRVQDWPDPASPPYIDAHMHPSSRRDGS